MQSLLPVQLERNYCTCDEMVIEVTDHETSLSVSCAWRPATGEDGGRHGRVQARAQLGVPAQLPELFLLLRRQALGPAAELSETSFFARV